ncbi:putative ubiquitin-conjugating enzyme E2 23 [Cyphellophora attinorum]|uniref:Putative ubiquitin-conjugating enzyme E2 23 n=1 Tax=Cyphellophora attinorum TaxID=1664694 RepID=A0A0N1H1I5_9EURO|nr:putative ubiquitin-conjugating enzyme E2 23 [Phialophora attinorum]KPI37984.1 putative ubiquitin-conjugating enzyme E2 23 [Phialophora attinorum]
MPLETHDTVVLRDDPDVIGTVEQTHIDSATEISLEDLLVLNYTNVPEHIFQDYNNTGTPPKGYVFVVCSREDSGAFLALEDDLILISRSFDEGDVIKRAGQAHSMIGTIIGIQETCTLVPALRVSRDGRLISASSRALREMSLDNHPPKRACTCDHRQYDLIRNVPAEELVRATTPNEDELVVMHNDWVGEIDSVDFDVVLLHQDKITSVGIMDGLSDLHLPILHPEKPLVHWPDLDGLEHPSVVEVVQGYLTLPAAEYPLLGQFVIASKTSLHNARWVHGQYDKNSQVVEGTVIDLVPRAAGVKWIAANPFTRKATWDVKLPSRSQLLFQNVSKFSKPSDLVPRGSIRTCATALGGPVTMTNTVFDSHGSPSGTTSVTKNVAYYRFERGSQVRFRDPAAAMQKYQGREDCGCGAFRPIVSDKYCPGFDVNFLNVVSPSQIVRVRWQNGQESVHPANDLSSFGAFEVPLVPGGIVLDKAGIKMMKVLMDRHYYRYDAPPQLHDLKDFNEMAFFESPHDLIASRVGVIQAVDPKERIAKVRWFQEPRVILIESGEALHPYSKYGPISDTIEELSLYEIMTFPAFDRRVLDAVLLPPSGIGLALLEKVLENKGGPPNHSLPYAVNSTLDFDRLVQRAIAICGEHGGLVQNIVSSDKTNIDVNGSWLGQIVAVGLDGNLTVRLIGKKSCQDVQIPLDLVLATINIDELGAVDYGDDDSEYDSVTGELLEIESRSPSPISEHIEYEGGQRLDEDEDDDAWVSAEEDLASLDDMDLFADSSSTENSLAPAFRSAINRIGRAINESDETRDSDEDIEMTDASTQTAAAQDSSTTSNLLALTVPTEPPPQFEVLSTAPPRDQFRVNEAPSSSPAFLKRIAKEHKALSTSLPTNQIYVRTYESRLDLFRCLVIGPPDTPYEDAPFLIDLHLGHNFPTEPPTAHFHSWTGGLGRINPNLYEEGKICLSLLGTWPGKEKQEGWTKESSILQILVSIQGLVMVRNPFFNEAGFEGYEAEGQYKTEAAQYAEKAFVMSRGFVRHALLTRVPVGMEAVLAWLYIPSHPRNPAENGGGTNATPEPARAGLLLRIIRRGQSLIYASQAAAAAVAQVDEGMVDSDIREHLMDTAGTNTGDATKAFLRPLSRGAIVMLRRWLGELVEAAK